MKTLKTGPITFDIAVIDGLRDEKDDKRLDGRVVHDKCRIELAAGMHPQHERAVLWHEIVHIAANMPACMMARDRIIGDAPLLIGY